MRLTKQVQRTLAVNDEVGEGKSSGRWPSVGEEVNNESPADAGIVPSLERNTGEDADWTGHERAKLLRIVPYFQI